MITHWVGKDLNIFRIPVRQLDMLFQTELVRCKETDSLFSVLRKMRDQRVGVVPIESSEGGYTVGLCFLNDLIYVLRQPDFYTLLSKPIMSFLKELNSFDDDISNSSHHDSAENVPININKTQHQVIEKSTATREMNQDQSSNKGSFSSEMSSEDAGQDTPFFSQGAFGTELIKGKKNNEIERVKGRSRLMSNVE